MSQGECRIREEDEARAALEAFGDEPRWIDVRGMLRSGHARVTGGTALDPGFVVKVVHGALSVVAVVGCPDPELIAHAAADVTLMTPVLAQVANAGHVGAALNPPGAPEVWKGERVIVHLGSEPEPPAPPPGPEGVRLLQRADPIDHLPPGLRYEISHARQMGPVASAFVEGRPVTFCYACWTTESLWDVSIDTLAEERGRSLASHTVRFMMDEMRCQGLAPVWCALASNRASLRVAEKMGFRPVDRIVAFSRGPWAFLTAGFDG